MNKYKLLIIACVLVSIFFLSKVYAFINDYTLLGKVIYIDPGHGGIDGGTSYKNIQEKDLNLKLSQMLEKELVSLGATVYLTRETDKDLSTTKINRKRSDLLNRAYLINKTNPDMYISIHLNYLSDSRWKGLQIFYNNNNKSNKDMAINLTKYIKEKTSNVREPKQNNTYYMYKHIKTSGVLIELGFLSNKDDRYRLTHKKYQEELIKNISYAIVKYFNKKDSKSLFLFIKVCYTFNSRKLDQGGNMKRKILLTLISFITFTPEIYAECTNEDFNDFKKISDEYKVTYEYNQETKLYDITVYDPAPDKYIVIINDLETVNLENIDKNNYTYVGISPGNYKITVEGINDACQDVFKTINLNLPKYNKYSEDPLCKGNEEFVLCQPTYDKDIDYDTFKERIEVYKKTKAENNIKNTDNNSKTKENNVINYIKDNIVQISLIAILLILIVIITISISKRQKKSRRLE